MNTMNDYALFCIKKRHNKFSKTIIIINKILVVISIYFIFGLLFQHVFANTHVNTSGVIEKAASNDPYQAQHGSVWLLPDNGVAIEALQMQTDVNIEITSHLARATVKQQFKNNSSLWAEGLYVFPLPENSAVDHFRMIVGERVIEGQIKERVAAKRSYERAKLAGKKASLIEQQRPNVFTTSLANIAPGETITVEFEYQQVLDYKDNSYRLRFPMVVGPRYHADQPTMQEVLNSEVLNPTADKTSVYTESADSDNINPTRIHISLDAGVNLYDLNSTYHRINVNQTSETRYLISTIGENIVADRDFELVWKPQLENRPQLSAFNEVTSDAYGDIGGGTDNDTGSDKQSYTMVTLLPPELSHLQQKVHARDVIFVIDVSGSMAGTSIEQAKSALITAVNSLSEIDRFNIIWFNNNADSLFPSTVAALPKYKTYAKRYIDKLQADGGTEMLPAMELALSNQLVFSRFRQVVFITDGNINNEVELFDVINDKLGSSRLFTIGIGSAPNAYFMRKAALKGRGTFTYIGDINEVHEKTTALLKKLETPALVNIKLSLENSDYDVYPKIIPDMYAGEPVTILIKGNKVPEYITIKGDYGNTEWQTRSDLSEVEQSGIRVAWAREKMSSLMSDFHEAKTENLRESIKQDVTNTALRHHLVSRYTSLLAVDVTPVNANGLLYKERLKNNLPFGWKISSATSGLMLAQTATDFRLNLILSVVFFLGGIFMYRYFYRGSVISKCSGIAE